MAEIRVEKKNRPVWPWILGILLAAVIIWMVVDNDDRDIDDGISTIQTDENLNNDSRLDRNTETQAFRSDTTGQENDAREYVSYIKENGKNVTVEHEYSHQALTRLSRALNSVANQSNTTNENRQELDKIRQQADKLTKNPTSTEHANIMSDAFTSAANILENIQSKLYPDLDDEVREVTEAAKKVKPNELVTNQKDAVKDFFEKSAEAIEAMTENV